MQFNTIKFLTIALAVATAIGCGKPQGVTAEIPDIPSVQQKTALTAAEDLDGLVTDNTAGMKIRIQDSKYVSVGKDINGKDRGATSWPGCYQN